MAHHKNYAKEVICSSDLKEENQDVSIFAREQWEKLVFTHF